MKITPQMQIDYAPALPMYRRRSIQRIAAIVVSILLLSAVGYLAVPRAWNHAELLYWQRRALNYSPPGDQVVLDTSTPFAGGTQPHDVISCLAGYGRMALAADRFMALASPPGQVPCSTLFLHERRNSLGQVRLVYVTIADGMADLAIDARVYIPGGAFKDPLETNIGRDQSLNEIIENNAPVRFFAGQPQCDSPSHFSIPFEIGGKRTVIDGWLMDNDTVKLNVPILKSIWF